MCVSAGAYMPHRACQRTALVVSLRRPSCLRQNLFVVSGCVHQASSGASEKFAVATSHLITGELTSLTCYHPEFYVGSGVSCNSVQRFLERDHEQFVHNLRYLTMLAILSVLVREARSLAFIQTFCHLIPPRFAFRCTNLALLLLNILYHFKCLLELAK